MAKAALVVQSFSKQQDGFAGFQAFVGLLGASVSGPGAMVSAGSPSGVELFVGWAQA